MSYSRPRLPGSIERALFRLYVNCQVGLSHPRELQQAYAFTYEELALIAGCGLRTMERWMSPNREPRILKEVYLRRLGEFYFLLNHYQQIPPELWELVCPLPPRLRTLLYPSESSSE